MSCLIYLLPSNFSLWNIQHNSPIFEIFSHTAKPMSSISSLYTQPSIQQTSIQRISDLTDFMYYQTRGQDHSKSPLLETSVR